IRTSSAVALVTRPVTEVPPRTIDTLLIAGGDDCGLQALVADESVRQWVIRASRNAHRYGSICTGTFVLAHFGLLSGRRVTTHWSKCAALAEQCPDVDVDTSSLFVSDGGLWTSAGVTTGIDMS